MSKDKPWKPAAYVTGGVVGLLLGVVSAHLYAQSVEENTLDDEPPARIGTADIFKIGLTAFGLLRSISDLGSKPPENRRR